MNIRQPCVDASVSVRAALIARTVPTEARTPTLAPAPGLNGVFDREVLTSAGAADPSISTDGQKQPNGIASESERVLSGGYLPNWRMAERRGGLDAKQDGATSLPSNHSALLAWGRGDFLQKGERTAPFARGFAHSGLQGAPYQEGDLWNFFKTRTYEKRKRRRR